MGNNKKVAKGGGEGKSGILNRDFVFFHETKQQPEHFEEGVCVPKNKWDEYKIWERKAWLMIRYDNLYHFQRNWIVDLL